MQDFRIQIQENDAANDVDLTTLYRSSTAVLWLFRYSDSVVDTLESNCISILHQNEIDRRDRYQREKDKTQFTVARALLRIILSRHCGIRPSELKFETNEFGRPNLVNGPAVSRGLSFNVAHTSGYIVIGTAYGLSIGVDVEMHAQPREFIPIARRFFHPIERTALMALPRKDQRKRFLEYWTLKEAYVKACGFGLSIPFDSFAIHLYADNRIHISLEKDDLPDPSRSFFWLVPVLNNATIAICLNNITTSTRNLTVFEVLPCFINSSCK